MIAYVVYLSGKLDQLEGKVYKSRVFNDEACEAHGWDSADYGYNLIDLIDIGRWHRDYYRVLSGLRPAQYSLAEWQRMYPGEFVSLKK